MRRRIALPKHFVRKQEQHSLCFAAAFGMSDCPGRYRSDINFAIVEKFREAGIDFPFPQRDLHIRGGVLKVESIAAEETARPSET